MPIVEISSLELAGLEPYRTLRRPEDHYRKRIFVAEGEKVVRRLLQSGLSVQSVLLTPQWLQKLAPPPETIDIYVADQRLLETIVGYRLHQGVMAVGLMPAEPDLTRILAETTRPALLVALDGVVHAENVGVVVRNAAAFGVDCIVVDSSTSSPYLRRAVRNSMGAVFRIPVLHVSALPSYLPELRNTHRFRILAAHPSGPSSIHDVDTGGNLCVIFGNEGSGISSSVLGVCDDHVSIPMHQGTDSLNVASASAVFLYEVDRRRHN